MCLDLWDVSVIEAVFPGMIFGAYEVVCEGCGSCFTSELGQAAICPFCVACESSESGIKQL